MSYTDKIDGKDVAIVLMTLGGVGGYLYLDHKLSLEHETATKLAILAQQTALALQAAQGVAATGAAAAQAQRALPPAPESRNAGRVPRLELAPHTFDDVFARRGRGVPVAYLRALALHESDMQPRLDDGPAWGLLQVLEVVRQDYNRREGANVVREDLLDPGINVSVAASALALIARSFATHHPNTRNMRIDWRNPQFVALLTFGWNAGWTEKAGVGRVASYLEQRDEAVNINAVADAAQAAGASPHLSNPRKLAWCKQVTRQYFAELADEDRLIEIEGGSKRRRSERPAIVVDDANASDDGEHVIVVQAPSADDDAGPITSPTQLEHDDGPRPITSPAQLDHAQAELHEQEHEPIVHPDHIAGPSAPPVQMQPSGGSGPIDPYGPPSGASGPVDPYAAEEVPYYGYPEDPYAFLPPPEAAPHA